MTTRLRAAAAAAALALASACAEPAPAPTDPGLSLHRDGADHRTIVVDPAGHGGRPTTIQAGIDQAPAGGRVLVLPGTYSEAIVINKGLTLQGLPSRHERVTIAPAGTPTIAVQVATVEPVTIRSLGVRFSGANGIRGDGAVDLTVEHASVTAVNAPLGVSHLVAVFNNAPATGRARLVVRHSFIDGNVAFTNSPTPAFPQSFGLRIQGDVDGVFAHNTIRRSGGACVFVTTRLDHGGETNADILENDIDECYPIGRAGAILVGPTGALPVPLPPFTATGRVNTIGNTIRNSSGSCLPLAAINYEAHGGRIEHNQILDFVQPCATEGGTRTLLGAIFVGSQPTRGFPPVEPVIRFNDIVGNAHAGLRLAANMTTPIDARCNYWGTATGPTVGAVIGSDVVMEAGAATPVLAPFATGPIADRRRHGHGGDRHGHGSCALDFSLWSAPVNLGATVNSSVADIQPAISPDGRSLYFSSARIGGLGGNDIWVSRRECATCPWGAPVNVAALNSTALDGGPSLSPDGHVMFFHSGRAGGPGNNDLYVSRRANRADDLAWEAPTVLGDGVNTAALENKPFFFATGHDGTGLLYFNRGPNANELNDLFVARVTRRGEVLAEAVPIAELNDPVTNEQAAHLRRDGRELLFQSNRAGSLGQGDLYVATRRDRHEPWSAPLHLGAPLNSTGRDAHPYLSRDATVLFFSSDRAGSLGERDIWMATRTRIGPRPH